MAASRRLKRLAGFPSDFDLLKDARVGLDELPVLPGDFEADLAARAKRVDEIVEKKRIEDKAAKFKKEMTAMLGAGMSVESSREGLPKIKWEPASEKMRGSSADMVWLDEMSTEMTRKKLDWVTGEFKDTYKDSAVLTGRRMGKSTFADKYLTRIDPKAGSSTADAVSRVLRDFGHRYLLDFEERPVIDRVALIDSRSGDRLWTGSASEFKLADPDMAAAMIRGEIMKHDIKLKGYKSYADKDFIPYTTKGEHGIEAALNPEIESSVSADLPSDADDNPHCGSW